MKFDLKTNGLVRFQKHGHALIVDSTIYRNEDFLMFGLVEFKKESIWALVHIPSERIIISRFYNKKDIEEYWDILAEFTDLNSLFLCNPKFDAITEEIRYNIEIAFKKYSLKKQRANDENCC